MTTQEKRAQIVEQLAAAYERKEAADKDILRCQGALALLSAIEKEENEGKDAQRGQE